MRPRILVTVDCGGSARRGVEFPAWVLKRAYTDAIARAGGVPILGVPGASPAELLEVTDGLVVTGGAFDLPPAWSGASAHGRIDAPQPERSAFERDLVREARTRGLPVLGICGGMQLQVVLSGGRLFGDLRTERPDLGEHEQPDSPAGPAHDVLLAPGTWLAAVAPRRRFAVNSTHHQGVEALGGTRAIGWADDGLPEVVDDGTPDFVGVQWHPELLDDDVSRALYAAWVDRARRTRDERRPRGRS